MNVRNIVSIDVGIVHLGLVRAVIRNGRICALPFIRLINLTRLRHIRVPYASCTLHHTNELADRFEHFIQEYGHIIDVADIVLVERQPICGLQAVQQLLFGRYRSKVVLVSPNAMHRHLKMSGSYEVRKLQSTQIMRVVFDKIDHDKTQLSTMDRMHDVADAICLLIFFVETILKRNIQDQVQQAKTAITFETNGKSIQGIFDRFKFNPSTQIQHPTYRPGSL